MSKYNLTEKQKHLLKTIVDTIRSGNDIEPLRPICAHDSSTIFGIDEDFGRNLLGDLEALCDLDFLGVRLNSKGNKIFSVKEAGFTAVDRNFEMIIENGSQNINIGAVIHEMSGGNLQAIGFATDANISQIINDPKLFSDEIDRLSVLLLDAIKDQLSGEKFNSYIKVVDALKAESKSEKPSPGLLKKIIGSLSFLGDIEGTIELTTKVWPLIYPLIVLISEKLSHLP